MEQFILHLFGDYVTQSDWMAQNKTKSTWAAFCHATVYSLPFLLLGSWWALLVIWSTHLLIDRFRLARYVAYLKNQLLGPAVFRSTKIEFLECCGAMQGVYDFPPSLWQKWEDCSGTGYHKDTPPFMAVWLMIACDNALHLAINYCALRWL